MNFFLIFSLDIWHEKCPLSNGPPPEVKQKKKGADWLLESLTTHKG